MTDISDDDLFEGAKDEFAAKEDMKDRLVAILVDGKRGSRVSTNNPGQTYPWISTTTVVLDDGLNGGTYTDLVPSVADNGAHVLRSFQWTPGGFVSRLEGRTPESKWLIGRVNEKPVKGRSAAWRPNPPTEADFAIAAQFSDVLKAEKDAILKAGTDAEPVF